MLKKFWNVYLSGEIHTNWRDKIINKTAKYNLPINFFSPIIEHVMSDDCGVEILGAEDKKFWHDFKGASINSIRTSNMIKNSDIVIVRFGEKYKQWNAAFDAGIATCLNKSLITFHSVDLDHALKEVDAAASAICRDVDEIINTLSYVITGKLITNKIS